MLTRYQINDPWRWSCLRSDPGSAKRSRSPGKSGGKIPLEFSTVPARVTARAQSPITGRIGYTIKTDFILAELDNAVRYFAAFFGPYPYQSFGGAFIRSDSARDSRRC
jgi:hypothetical protein